MTCGITAIVDNLCAITDRHAPLRKASTATEAFRKALDFESNLAVDQTKAQIIKDSFIY